MPVTIQLREETLSGALTGEFSFEMPTEVATLRALIEEHVRREVAEALRRPAPPTALDDAAETERALEAFRRGRVLALVGERQVTDLDAPLALTLTTTVRFLALVPLAGG